MNLNTVNAQIQDNVVSPIWLATDRILLRNASGKGTYGRLSMELYNTVMTSTRTWRRGALNRIYNSSIEAHESK